MTNLRTAVFFAGWICFTAVLGMIALPAILSRRATWMLARGWTGATLAWLKLSCNITTCIEGREHIPASGGLIAAKHQSAWDTLALWHALKNPAFVMKRELYYIPIFGWYLWRAGQIAIDRTAGRKAMAIMVAGAQTALAAGRCVVIFPEGTRVAAGAEKEFRAGVARISAALAVPVVPVSLNGGRFWPKGDIRKFPGMAILKFLTPVAACSNDATPWLKNLQQLVNRQSRAIGG
jgi:1-acyl-sn-glycerol-3-phosphate acyltransferase